MPEITQNQQSEIEKAEAAEAARKELLSESYTRSEDVLGGIKVRRLSAMDIAILRRNKNRFVTGFTPEFIEEMKNDSTRVAELVPDVIQFIWLFKASEDDYIKAVQDNDFYIKSTIRFGMGIGYMELTDFIPDIQRIVGESQKASVIKAPEDEDTRRSRIGKKKPTSSRSPRQIPISSPSTPA